MVPSPSQVALQKQNVVLPKATPAPTLPVPEKPIEPPTPVKKDLTVPAPTLSASQRPNVVLPQSPSAPALPVPEKPIEPPTPVRKDLTIPKPTLSASQRPNVVLPKGPATPAIPIPEKPIELTSVQKDLTIPSPSQVAPSQRQNIALPNATATPALPAPERPIEPPTVARKDLSIPAPSQAPSQARSVVLPGQRTAPDVAAPAQIAAVETHGPDQQNLVSVSPLPAPPQPGALPDGVARGRFAISPDANLSGSGRTPGVKADNVGTTTAGVGKKADGPAAGTTGNAGPSGNGVADKGGTAGATTGTGSSKDGASGNGNGGNGRGNSSGNTPGKTPFPGITVQGGRLEGNGGIVSAPPSPRTLTIGSAPSAVPAGTYGMTVVSNAGTGGGLPDLGVFSHEKVYTVYLDMKKKSGDPGPSWTLQYALMPANPNPNGLIPPFPMVKESPNFAIELVQKNLNQLVVVYAIIDAKGKLQQVSVKQTPDPQLNQAALAALQKWTFRPAEANGRPVSVKVLLGIPVSQP
jgi:TonB family protein